MKSLPLTAYARTTKGRAAVKKLRGEGRLPAVIYGDKSKATPLEVKTREFQHIINHSVSENLLVDLTIDGDSRNRLVLLQEIQHNNLTGEVLHVDFHEVSKDKKVNIEIPIETIGEPKGVKTGGGILEHVLFKIRVSALPLDLPEFVQLDVSELDIGESIHVGELPALKGVEFHADENITVVSVTAPRVDTDAVAEVAEEAAPDKKDAPKADAAKGDAAKGDAPKADAAKAKAK